MHAPAHVNTQLAQANGHASIAGSSINRTLGDDATIEQVLERAIFKVRLGLVYERLKTGLCVHTGSHMGACVRVLGITRACPHTPRGPHARSAHTHTPGCVRFHTPVVETRAEEAWARDRGAGTDWKLNLCAHRPASSMSSTLGPLHASSGRAPAAPTRACTA